MLAVNRITCCVGWFSLLFLLGALGCGPATTSQALIGAWEGRPDTVAAKRARNPIPTAPGYEELAESDTPAKSTEADDELESLQPSEQTYLEAYDFAVLIEFKANGLVAMQMNGGQLINGVWRVLSTDVGVSIIEIIDGVPPEDGEEPTEAALPLTRRRFSLELDKGNHGFTLREEGVDPRFGWLHFKRLK